MNILLVITVVGMQKEENLAYLLIKYVEYVYLTFLIPDCFITCIFQKKQFLIITNEKNIYIGCPKIIWKNLRAFKGDHKDLDLHSAPLSEMVSFAVRCVNICRH